MLQYSRFQSLTHIQIDSNFMPIKYSTRT